MELSPIKLDAIATSRRDVLQEINEFHSFYGVVHRLNLVVLGGDSCGSGREPESDSCTFCSMYLKKSRRAPNPVSFTIIQFECAGKLWISTYFVPGLRVYENLIT